MTVVDGVLELKRQGLDAFDNQQGGSAYGARLVEKGPAGAAEVLQTSVQTRVIVCGLGFEVQLRRGQEDPSPLIGWQSPKTYNSIYCAVGVESAMRRSGAWGQTAYD